jgi:hypothetical protein
VGVDEYDASANDALSDNNYDLYNQISQFFKGRFFATIKQAFSTVVDKCWITGVLPDFRDCINPLDAVTLISHWPEYHGICGLTAEEVRAIAKAYLPRLPPQNIELMVGELRRRYDGSPFCNARPPLDTLYSPESPSRVCNVGFESDHVMRSTTWHTLRRGP